MNAQTKVKVATINWTQPICTSHDTPRIVGVLEDRDDGMKRVVVPQNNGLAYTTWFYDQAGLRPRCTEPEFNLVNYDPGDNVQRMALEKAR